MHPHLKRVREQDFVLRSKLCLFTLIWDQEAWAVWSYFLFFNLFLFYFVKQVPVLISWLAECCRTVSLWSFRNVFFFLRIGELSFGTADKDRILISGWTSLLSWLETDRRWFESMMQAPVRLLLCVPVPARALPLTQCISMFSILCLFACKSQASPCQTAEVRLAIQGQKSDLLICQPNGVSILTSLNCSLLPALHTALVDSRCSKFEEHQHCFNTEKQTCNNVCKMAS